MDNPNENEIKGFVGKQKTLLDDLKSNSVKLLLSILEGPVDEQISERVSSSLGDFLIVVNRMEAVYKQFLGDELDLPESAAPWQV